MLHVENFRVALLSTSGSGALLVGMAALEVFEGSTSSRSSGRFEQSTGFVHIRVQSEAQSADNALVHRPECKDASCGLKIRTAGMVFLVAEVDRC